MPRLIFQTPVANSMTEGNTTQPSRLPDFGVLEQYLDFPMGDASNPNRSKLFNPSGTNAATGTYLQPVTFYEFSAAVPGSWTMQLQKGSQPNLVPVSGAHHENWVVSNMAASSSRTDTSTDVDGEDKNQQVKMSQSAGAVTYDSGERSKEKNLDQKKLRRLAQNREAARKSRLRKKAHIQQLANSRLKLIQLEQAWERIPRQGIVISTTVDQPQKTSGNGAMAFDAEYACWLEEHDKLINELRTAVNSHASEPDLHLIVENVVTQFNDIFRLKGTAAKADVFHILSGMWKTPVERYFMWIGGFRPSELLKFLVNHLEPLTEEQLEVIYNLKQSSHQAEDALSKGKEALQQSIAETLAIGTCGPEGSPGNVANYKGQMAMAMGKLGTLEGFLREADSVRQQTLQEVQRILTTRQSARALLTINDYFSRLRALSSLWLARPRV